MNKKNNHQSKKQRSNCSVNTSNDMTKVLIGWWSSRLYKCRFDQFLSSEIARLVRRHIRIVARMNNDRRSVRAVFAGEQLVRLI